MQIKSSNIVPVTLRCTRRTAFSWQKEGVGQFTSREPYLIRGIRQPKSSTVANGIRRRRRSLQCLGVWGAMYFGVELNNFSPSCAAIDAEESENDSPLAIEWPTSDSGGEAVAEAALTQMYKAATCGDMGP